MRALALLSVVTFALTTPPSHTPRPSKVPRAVLANDNRRAAGARRGDTVVVQLNVTRARWSPEGSKAPSIDVAAIAEGEGSPVIPAPLLRVRTGATMRVRV